MTIDRVEKTIVSLTCTGHALTHTYMLIVPVLLSKLMDQFGLSLTQITSMWTMCYFLYGVMALPAGFLADKWSSRAILIVFFLGTPMAVFIMGLARSALELGIGMALLGLFSSLYHPSGLAIISHTIRERGKALGLQGVAGNIGLAFSPIIVGSLATRLSWRSSCYILALPGFIAVAIFLLVSRSIRMEAQEPVMNFADPLPKDPLKQKRSLYAVILLYAAMTAGGFTYQGMTTMLPTYLDSKLLFSVSTDFGAELDGGVLSERLLDEFKSRGIELPEGAKVSVKKSGSRWTISKNSSSYNLRKEADRINVYTVSGKGKVFTTMILMVGVLGQYMGGYLSDRRRRTRLYLLFNAISLPLMVSIGLMIGAPLIFIAALFALFHFAGQPVENSLVAFYTPPRLRSSGYGLKFVFTFGIGSFASAFSGYVGEHFGLSSVFVALGGVILLMVITIAILVVVAKEEKTLRSIEEKQ